MTIEVHSEKIKQIESYCEELGEGLDKVFEHLIEVLSIIGDTHPESTLIYQHVQEMIDAMTVRPDNTSGDSDG